MRHWRRCEPCFRYEWEEDVLTSALVKAATGRLQALKPMLFSHFY